MRLTVLSWNLDGFTHSDAKRTLLEELAWHVVFLQEVTVESWADLQALGGRSAWSAPHLPSLARPPRYHSAVIARDGFEVEDLGVVPGVPSPERTVRARIGGEGVSFMAASLALPPGVTWGDAGKGRQADRIATWLKDRDAPVLVGIDANAPKFDREELADCVWWNEQEPLLLGVDRVHDLRDVYREHLDFNPSQKAAVLRERPDGPLAVSHVRGRGQRATPCRYDHILASPEFEIESARYLWDDARAAGSDHAIVMAELQMARSHG